MEKKKDPSGVRLGFCKGDLAAAAVVLLAAAGLFLLFLLPPSQSGSLTVEIRQDGQLLESLPLDQDQRITVEGDYTNVILIEDGQVRVESSTCPGGDCVHSGKISRVGRSVVCLPNRVEIRIVGGVPDEVDMVVG